MVDYIYKKYNTDTHISYNLKEGKFKTDYGSQLNSNVAIESQRSKYGSSYSIRNDGTFSIDGWIKSSEIEVGFKYYYPQTDPRKLRELVVTKTLKVDGRDSHETKSRILENVPVYSYSKGSYIEDVVAPDGTYPSNGKHSDGYWYVRGEKANKAPSQPSSIKVEPTEPYIGGNVSVSWGQSIDPEGKLAAYELERSINGATFRQVYRGTNRNYTEAVGENWKSVKYQVRGVDDQGAYSDYRGTAAITVLQNRGPSISGSDTDLGGIKSWDSIDFTISDEDIDDTLDLVVTVAGIELTKINNASQNDTYTVNIPNEIFNDLAFDTRHEVRIKVTDSKGAVANRYYWFRKINTAPEITFTEKDLGEQNEPFSVNYTVDDAEKDIVTLEIFYLDKSLEKIEDVELGVEQSFTIDLMDYVQIPNGLRSIRFVATDIHGASRTETVSFSKNITSTGYEYKEEKTTMPTSIVVNVTWHIADGADGTIQVCNNMMDDNPTWEDYSRNGGFYQFVNKEKTATNWGIGVRVNIDKNEAKDLSYIENILLTAL